MGNQHAGRAEEQNLHSVGLTEGTYNWLDATSITDAVNLIREGCVALRFPWQINIGDLEVLQLIPVLRENTTLRALHLWDNNIGDDSVVYLAEIVANNTTLEYLKLGASNIRGIGSQALVTAMLQNHTLVELDFSRVTMPDEATKTMSVVLRHNRVLRVLALANNEIGVAGAQYIAGALEVNEGLVRLDMSDNNIGNRGCAALAKALTVNETLLVLWVGGVSSTNIDVTAARAFADALKQNDNLVALAIKNSNIPREASNVIVERLLHNTKIHHKTRKAFKEMVNKASSQVAWHRAKLMVVGQGRSGKSATVRSLLGVPIKASTTVESPSTIGLEIIRTGAKPEHHGAWKELKKSEQEDYTVMSVARLVAQKFKKRRARGSQRASSVESLNFAESSPTMRRMNSSGRSASSRRRSTRGAGHRANGSGAKVLKSFRSGVRKSTKLELMTEDEIAQKFHTKLISQAEDIEETQAISFTIWDFGGQQVFYSLHHLFLTRYGIYLIVFNMKEMLDDPEETKIYLRFWLESIRIHAKDAPIILVGSHLDKAAPRTRFSLFKAPRKDQDKVGIINESLKSVTLNFEHVIFNNEKHLFYFPVNNNMVATVTSLRQTLGRVARTQDYVNKRVSLRWLRCLDKMIQDGHSWLSVTRVRDIAGQVGIQKSDEVQSMLVYFHHLGAVLYYSETEALREVVTTDPQWLVDSLSKVIRDRTLHKEELDMDDVVKTGMEQDLDRLFNSALASRDLLEYLWNHEKVDFLIDFMHRTMLLSEWSFAPDQLYFVPSLITNDITADFTMPWDFYFDFSDSYLPTGVFERLCCLCVIRSGATSAESASIPEPEIGKAAGRIFFDSETFVTISVSIKHSRISVHFANRNDAAEYLRVVKSMLRKVNNDIFHEGLSWMLMLKNGEGYISYTDAKVRKLDPWFNGIEREDTTVDINAFLTG